MSADDPADGCYDSAAEPGGGRRWDRPPHWHLGRYPWRTPRPTGHYDCLPRPAASAAAEDGEPVHNKKHAFIRKVLLEIVLTVWQLSWFF